LFDPSRKFVDARRWMNEMARCPNSVRNAQVISEMPIARFCRLKASVWTFTLWWTATACLSTSLSRPVRRTTIG
jgi:hypothetical protein